MGELLTLLAAEPPKMGPIPWIISPWVIAGFLAGWLALCLALIYVGWRFRLPWVLWIAEVLMPGEGEPRRRKRRRR